LDTAILEFFNSTDPKPAFKPAQHRMEFSVSIC